MLSLLPRSSNAPSRCLCKSPGSPGVFPLLIWHQTSYPNTSSCKFPGKHSTFQNGVSLFVDGLAILWFLGRVVLIFSKLMVFFCNTPTQVLASWSNFSWVMSLFLSLSLSLFSGLSAMFFVWPEKIHGLTMAPILPKVMAKRLIPKIHFVLFNFSLLVLLKLVTLLTFFCLPPLRLSTYTCKLEFLLLCFTGTTPPSSKNCSVSLSVYFFCNSFLEIGFSFSVKDLSKFKDWTECKKGSP